MMKEVLKRGKKNNKGFSLVELIVVIAIMAVLIGLLAPQFIKYLESSKISKDTTTISELENAIKIALANEAIYKEVSDLPGNVVVTFSGTALTEINASTPLLNAEVAKTIKMSKTAMQSTKYKTETAGDRATLTINKADMTTEIDLK